MISNFHTHSTFCDGTNTAEEMVLSAIKNGFSKLGFSSHAYTYFDTHYCLKDTEAYKNEISRLKIKYKDKIKLYCGIELDAYGEKPKNMDYYIGSVHYFKVKDNFYPVDSSADLLKEAYIKGFNSDVYALLENYYNAVANMAKVFKPNIIGHFDLITKFNDDIRIFDENDNKYKKIVIDTIDNVMQYCKLFEINTGAMARGCKTIPYPSQWILRELSKRDVSIIITTDAHSSDKINFAYDIAYKLAVECGAQKKIINSPIFDK